MYKYNLKKKLFTRTIYDVMNVGKHVKRGMGMYKKAGFIDIKKGKTMSLVLFCTVII